MDPVVLIAVAVGAYILFAPPSSGPPSSGLVDELAPSSNGGYPQVRISGDRYSRGAGGYEPGPTFQVPATVGVGAQLPPRVSTPVVAPADWERTIGGRAVIPLAQPAPAPAPNLTAVAAPPPASATRTTTTATTTTTIVSRPPSLRDRTRDLPPAEEPRW